jgi:nitrous oxide reductase
MNRAKQTSAQDEQHDPIDPSASKRAHFTRRDVLGVAAAVAAAGCAAAGSRPAVAVRARRPVAANDKDRKSVV